MINDAVRSVFDDIVFGFRDIAVVSALVASVLKKKIRKASKTELIFVIMWKKN